MKTNQLEYGLIIEMGKYGLIYDPRDGYKISNGGRYIEVNNKKGRKILSLFEEVIGFGLL